MTLHTIKHQICAAAIVLSLVLVTHGVYGRQDLGAYAGRQDVAQTLLDELLASANEEALYNEWKKYQRQQPNYLSKWPGLRDLLQTADYDDNAIERNNELTNVRFMERLRQLAANSVEMSNADDDAVANVEVLPTPMPLRNTQAAVKESLKEHGIKKNVQFRKQYMSPCHFKICNMGRKRNARFFYF